ncbi:MAG: hypothetical protein WA964_05940 [Ilumatobacter sp.]|uniref:COG1470 family protein n=1 Tax=Ilumatobacter sp. TaxID=1967498 RepID=UPI003C7312A8
MSVTASFQPDRISAAPGETAALSLHLQNNTDAERMVTLRAGGGLAAQTVLQTETIYLDPNEHFEVPVIVDASASLAAGSHSCVIEILDDNETSSAAATIEIDSTEAWTATLEPQRSKSATAGRHKVAIENAGNVPLMVELAATSAPEVATELAAPVVNIDPGKTARVEFRVAPHERFWNGPSIEHPFSLAVAGSNGDRSELDGIFEQGPRLRPWLLPAAAGTVAALLLGTLAWYTVLKPSVLDAAREDATEQDVVQQAELDDQVTAIEAAAEESAELPLGDPTDLRLSVDAAPATTSTEEFDFDVSGVGRILSISDVIFQNPTGAVGRVELLRDGDVLLDQEMANFRDLDFHLVAPLQVDSGSSISLRVTCETPGPGTETCEAAATVTGFVDDI